MQIVAIERKNWSAG